MPDQEVRSRSHRASAWILGTGAFGHVSDAKAWSAFSSLGPDASPCGSVNVAGVSSSSAAVASPEPPTRVHVTGAEGSLARRVLALLADDPVVVDGSSTASDVVVHLGAGEHDLRARRRENVTDGAAEMLDHAIAGHARHLVLVSSAMVYGAYANNPVPLTEDAILRPDVDFVYARQLATVEALADRWRRTQPGRTVSTYVSAAVSAAVSASNLTCLREYTVCPVSLSGVAGTSLTSNTLASRAASAAVT